MMSHKHNSSLDATRRRRDLEALAGGQVVDLLVVGLGVTGAGVALDAASRGLSVAAVDAADLAHGTSRWSSKLVHGGLRYLTRLQFGIAYESAVERGVLMTHTAPHLVSALPMVLPLTPTVSPARSALAHAGVMAGDVLRRAAGTDADTLPRPRRLTGAEISKLAPAVRRDGLRGGLLSWDGQLSDDVRLVVALARTAAAHGARIVTRCRVETLAGDGAHVRDTLTGERHELRARAVVNATGVWADQLVPEIRLRPSRGSHLVLPATALAGLCTGLTVPVPGEASRFVFALPQLDGRVYVGLTDQPVDGPVPDRPEATRADIGYLLHVLNSVLETPVRPTDVIGTFAGLRPLLETRADSTADISRRHAVLTSPTGVVTVVGGKLTTYRRMAEDAVDAVVRRRGLDAGRCRTARLPLVGAAAPSRLAAVPAPRRLVRRYGTEAPELLIGDPALAEPVAPGIPTIRAEVLWAVRHEGALTVDDVLDRRTRIGLVPADRARAQPVVEEILQACRP